MSKIQLKNIWKTFQKEIVLKDVNLTIDNGEFVSLLGKSGSGKSTTLKIIAGIIPPDKGDILFNDISYLKVPIEKRSSVIVFQEHLLFPHLNLEDNIGFGLKMAKFPKGKIKERTNEIVKLLGLEGLERKYPNELSGGQQQRAAIGRAIIVEPKVLLLDEPFSSLDINTRNSMRELVLRIQKQLKITTILVTHDKEEAFIVSHRVALMIDGSIEQFDTPENIYEKPISKKAADFLGNKNYIEGKIERGIFYSEYIKAPAHKTEEGSAVMMFKPEDCDIFSSPQPNGVKAMLTRKIYGGDRSYYMVTVDNYEFRCLVNKKENFQVGDEVFLLVDISKAVFYQV